MHTLKLILCWSPFWFNYSIQSFWVHTCHQLKWHWWTPNKVYTFTPLHPPAKARVRRELTKHQRDLIVERYQSGRRYKIFSTALQIPWSTVKTVIMKWRKYGTTVTTKNWMSLQNWWKDKTKTGQGGCQEAYSNTEGAAGISGKNWLCTTTPIPKKLGQSTNCK